MRIPNLDNHRCDKKLLIIFSSRLKAWVAAYR